MKRLYTLSLGILAGLLLTGCSSSYSRYWHEEEDDVYFTSKTKEEVEAYETFQENSDSDENWNYRDNYPQDNDTYERDRNRSIYTTTPSIPRNYPKSNKKINAPTPTRKTKPTTPTKKDNSIKN